jgi:hypothetical protein
MQRPELALIDQGTTYITLRVDSSSLGYLNLRLDSENRLIAFAKLEALFRPSGFWRSTSDGDRFSLALKSPSTLAPPVSIPPDRLLAARTCIADTLVREDQLSPANAQSLITTGSYGDRHILWSGVALNALSILNACALLYSLAWLPSALARLAHALNFRAKRRRRRWSRLQCTACGYDLLHTPADDMHLTTCPECGTLRTPNHPD